MYAQSTTATFNANGFNVTFATYTLGATINMGSGTWTVTGAGASAWLDSASAISASTSTLKFTSASAKTFASNSRTYNNIWNAGAGALTVGNGNLTFNNIRADAGTTTLFKAGNTITFASLTFDATAGANGTVSSTASGSTTTITKTGGGLTTLDRFNIKDIIANGTSATYKARSSVDQGNNTGITFVSGNSNLLQFF